MIHAQKKFIRALDIDKARLNLLAKFWNDTHQKLVLQIIKAKKETKKLKALQQISTEMRDAVLSRYFNKCKKKHSAAYFEWRR